MLTKYLFRNVVTVLIFIFGSTVSLAAQKPSFNKPTNFKDIPVYRLQVAFRTAGSKNAETDDKVFVQLSSNMNPYYLNYGHDDREKNKYEVYDIIDPSISFIRDIEYLNITKMGTDGWNIAKVQLIVNGHLIFNQNYTKKIIDGNDGAAPILTFSAKTLQKNASWGYNNRAVHMPPFVLKKSDLVSMIEGYMGNQIQYIKKYNVKWGNKSGINTVWGAPVEATYRNKKRLSIDLDLQVEITEPNPELDVDFDIVVTCNKGKVNMEISNFRAHVDYLNLFKVASFNSDFAKYLNRSFNVPVCNAHFNPDGSLSFL